MKFFFDKICFFIATVGGVGRFPFAPGTAGSLVAMVPIYFLTKHYSPELFLPVMITGIMLVFFVGVLASNIVVSRTSINDPSFVVIDEVVGQWLTLVIMPIQVLQLKPWLWGIGFVLFRFFDILKPFGIKRLENLRGGWGIMLDDFLAGIYAGISLFALSWLG